MWKVSVQDMVKANKLIDDSFGIPNYHMITYNPHLDKPTVFKIAKPSDKLKDFTSVI